MMVYGTLKVDGYNWAHYLSGDRSLYIDTRKMQEWYYGGGLSANYSGNPEDSLVVDIFQVDPTRLKEINQAVDGLEGTTRESEYGYQPAAVPVTLRAGTQVWNEEKELVTLEEDTVVIAKAYPIIATSRDPEGRNDYIANRVAANPENYRGHVTETHPENGQNFLNFYNI